MADLRPDLAALFLSTSRYTPEEVGVHSNRVVIAACSGCGEPRERQVFYLAKHPRCRACTRTRQDTVEQVVCPDCKRLRTVAYYDREVAKHRPCPKCASKATQERLAADRHERVAPLLAPYLPYWSPASALQPEQVRALWQEATFVCACGHDRRCRIRDYLIVGERCVSCARHAA
ncbi:hypothetical protein [Jatrophihabitans endophyticus]|uniref:hypothetical protein n=1 Tax=Jatrophihabitans endophyticus TaxID=1206085 RepID=UPI0011612417|nr:hypothetical protein [Jatrophihabitans endophyticus]